VLVFRCVQVPAGGNDDYFLARQLLVLYHGLHQDSVPGGGLHGDDLYVEDGVVDGGTHVVLESAHSDWYQEAAVHGAHL
jgi:hypothetical protein